MALIDQADQAAAAQPNAGSAPSAAPDSDADDASGAPSQPDGDADDGSSGGQPMSEQDIQGLQQAIAAKIPPQLQDAYQRVMVAGQKVLYSPQSSDMLREEINSSDPNDKKLAGAAAGLMSLLNRSAGGKIPPAVYVPAGASLLLDIAEVMVKGGQTLTSQDVRDGLDQFSAAVMAHNGATPGQVAQTVGGQQSAPQAPTPPDPTANLAPQGAPS